METGRNNSNFSEYEQFAHDLYDDVDHLVTVCNTPSMYEFFDDRYCKIELTAEEIKQNGLDELLSSYAVDTPHYIEITLKGHNPYTSPNVAQAFIWITMKHYEMELVGDDLLQGAEITSDYTVVMEPRNKRPVQAYKDVKRAITLPKENGILSLPLDLNHIYYSAAPINHDEGRALRVMINTLSRTNAVQTEEAS